MFLINSSLLWCLSLCCSLKNAINFELSHFSTSTHSWHERGERSSANFSVRAECDRVQRKSQHNTIFSLQLNSIHPFWNSKPRTGWRKRENRVSWQQGETTHRRTREQEQRKGEARKGLSITSAIVYDFFLPCQRHTSAESNITISLAAGADFSWRQMLRLQPLRSLAKLIPIDCCFYSFSLNGRNNSCTWLRITRRMTEHKGR